MQSIRPRLLALAGMQLRGPLPAAGKKASKDKGASGGDGNACCRRRYATS